MSGLLKPKTPKVPTPPPPPERTDEEIAAAGAEQRRQALAARGGRVGFSGPLGVPNSSLSSATVRLLGGSGV
mgnify:CR=1 FL=1